MYLAYIKLILAGIIFGSIGLFVKEIPMASAEMVFIRTFLGGSFLTIVAFLKKEKITKENLRKNLVPMVLSGFFLGTSWLALFEAYKNTTVSVATLTYYLAPVFVILLAPFTIGERITKSKLIGVCVAILGMVLVNGTGDIGGLNPRLGIICGLLAGLGYAFVTILNKKINGIPGISLTVIQLFSAWITLAGYLIISKNGQIIIPRGRPIAYLLIIGIVHAGIALYFFFSALQELPAQTVAIFSYIDPLSAIIFSSIFLGERLSVLQVIGGTLILLGAGYGELSNKSLEDNNNQQVEVD